MTANELSWRCHPSHWFGEADWDSSSTTEHSETHTERPAGHSGETTSSLSKAPTNLVLRILTIFLKYQAQEAMKQISVQSLFLTLGNHKSRILSYVVRGSLFVFNLFYHEVITFPDLSLSFFFFFFNFQTHKRRRDKISLKFNLRTLVLKTRCRSKPKTGIFRYTMWPLPSCPKPVCFMGLD